MADIADVLKKVRALGADVALDGNTMKIVGSIHLSDKQRSWLADNRAAVEQHLRSTVPPVAEPSENDTPAHTWGQFARILYGNCPEDKDKFDWSYFVTEMGKVVRGHFGAGA